MMSRPLFVLALAALALLIWWVGWGSKREDEDGDAAATQPVAPPGPKPETLEEFLTKAEKAPLPQIPPPEPAPEPDAFGQKFPDASAIGAAKKVLPQIPPAGYALPPERPLPHKRRNSKKGKR